MISIDGHSRAEGALNFQGSQSAIPGFEHFQPKLTCEEHCQGLGSNRSWTFDPARLVRGCNWQYALNACKRSLLFKNVFVVGTSAERKSCVKDQDTVMLIISSRSLCNGGDAPW